MCCFFFVSLLLITKISRDLIQESDNNHCKSEKGGGEPKIQPKLHNDKHQSTLASRWEKTRAEEWGSMVRSQKACGLVLKLLRISYIHSPCTWVSSSVKVRRVLQMISLPPFHL